MNIQSSAYLHYTFQTCVNIDIDIASGRTVQGTFVYVSKIIHNWITQKFPALNLPSYPGNFQKNQYTQTVETLYSYNDCFYCIKTTHTDKEIPTTNLTASSTTFTIKCAAKAVSVLQTAINSGKGNPIGQAETQLAKAIVAKVDNDVIAAAYTSKKTSGDGTAQISYAGIVDANTSFLDEEDGIEKVMFINPVQEATLLKDPNFLSADKFTAGVAVNGAIGKIAGAWIKKSKKVRLVTAAVDASSGTAVTADNIAELQAKVDPTVKLEIGNKVKDIAAANQYYVCPVLKMEPDSSETEYTEDELAAITIFLKKNTQVDHEWFPKKQKHDITATKYYGVALTNTAKVVLAKFKK